MPKKINYEGNPKLELTKTDFGLILTLLKKVDREEPHGTGYKQRLPLLMEKVKNKLEKWAINEKN